MEESMAKILVECLMAKNGNQNPYDAIEHILNHVRSSIGKETVDDLIDGTIKKPK